MAYFHEDNHVAKHEIELSAEGNNKEKRRKSYLPFL